MVSLAKKLERIPRKEELSPNLNETEGKTQDPKDDQTVNEPKMLVIHAKPSAVVCILLLLPVLRMCSQHVCVFPYDVNIP